MLVEVVEYAGYTNECVAFEYEAKDTDSLLPAYEFIRANYSADEHSIMNVSIRVDGSYDLFSR